MLTISIVAAGMVLAAFTSTRVSTAPRRSSTARSVAIGSQSRNAVRTVPKGIQNFWTQANGPQGGDGIALARNSRDDLFVGTQGGVVFRSTDTAETGIGINNGSTATNVRALASTSVDHVFART